MDSFSIYQKFMESLDSAFMARRGMGCPPIDDWGERFFRAFDGKYQAFDEEFIIIYAAASQLLHRFALGRKMEDYAWIFYQNPGSFAKTVRIMLETGLFR
jgi:hypothetical protein